MSRWMLCWAFLVRAATASHSMRQKFGHSLLEDEFLVNYTNFNHGSFGACPRSVLEYQSSLRLLQEQMPDPWMRMEYKKRLNETRRHVAKYIHAKNSDQVVLVESASTAVNSILRSFKWRRSDIIMYFSVAYGMVKNTAKWLQKQELIEIIEIPVHFPIDNETVAFLTPLKRQLDQLKRDGRLDQLRVTVLDHIASVPAVKEPIQLMAQLIKSYNDDCFVLVDGAHAMGQVQRLDIQDMAPMDAYLSNGHKWLYSAKGSAFLWVNASVVTPHFPEPTVISSANSPDTSLVERYAYVSTRDYTAFLSLSKALEFRQTMGEAAIYAYVRNLALQAKHYLIKTWNVSALAPDSMEEFMINIRLPLPPPPQEGDAVTVQNDMMCTTTTTTSMDLHSWLLDNHNIYMLVLPTNDGYYYTRLSAQVYLEFKDFIWLGDLVLDFVQGCSNDLSQQQQQQ